MNFHAFISYSHSDCGNLAPSIQKALENIGKPWYKLSRNINIFRDETNLAANPNLWSTIQIALGNSQKLILLASPLAAQSYWVNKEIEEWIKNHYSDAKGILNIYIIKTSGNLQWDFRGGDFDWEKTDCLPVTLKNKFVGEPLWIDLSQYVNQNNLPINYKSPNFTSRLVKIVAGILNKAPRDVDSEELSRRRNTSVALISICIAFVSIISLGYLFYSQNKINKKYSIANNLIAEGNKYSEANINKTLLLYGYAYSISNDTSIFNILNNYFNSYTIYELNTYIDTINLFHSKKTLERIDENLEINFVLDSLKLLGNSKILKDKNDSLFYFETDIETQINNLKKQNKNEDVSFYCSGDRYNFILSDKFLYIFLGKMHEGDADYYLDYVESEPLFKLQLLYNDSLENNVIKMGEYHNWQESFSGIYFDQESRKLYILAKKEPWINPNIQKTHYELYTFDLFNSYKLTQDKNYIIIEILKNNGQNDLSKNDKIKLNIIN